MNLHIKYIFIAIAFVCVLSCKKQVKTNEAESKVIVTEKTAIKSIKPLEVSNQETLEVFLERAKKAAQSEDENDLKSIIQFPLLGQGDGYTNSFNTFDDLKKNGRIFSFFKENLSISINIEKDDLGEKWYSIKYKYPNGKNDYYNYYKLDTIKGKYIIVGVYIPRA